MVLKKLLVFYMTIKNIRLHNVKGLEPVGNEESNASFITVKKTSCSLPEYEQLKDELLKLPLYDGESGSLN